jgi:hypothetical protein
MKNGHIFIKKIPTFTVLRGNQTFVFIVIVKITIIETLNFN